MHKPGSRAPGGSNCRGIVFVHPTGRGIFRKGVWGGKNGTLFPHYPTITRPVEGASDHAAIYADVT